MYLQFKKMWILFNENFNPLPQSFGYPLPAPRGSYPTYISKVDFHRKFSKLDKDEQKLDELFDFVHKLSDEKLANDIKEKFDL